MSDVGIVAAREVKDKLLKLDNKLRYEKGLSLAAQLKEYDDFELAKGLVLAAAGDLDTHEQLVSVLMLEAAGRLARRHHD